MKYLNISRYLIHWLREDGGPVSDMMIFEGVLLKWLFRILVDIGVTRMIGCSGGCSHIPGGWDCCLNLIGGASKYYSSKRTFDANHPFRRRRWFRKKTTAGKACSLALLPLTVYHYCFINRVMI